MGRSIIICEILASFQAAFNREVNGGETIGRRQPVLLSTGTAYFIIYVYILYCLVICLAFKKKFVVGVSTLKIASK